MRKNENSRIESNNEMNRSIVRIQGGLGNQLFQLALAITLRQKPLAKVSLDYSLLSRPRKRETKRKLEITELVDALNFSDVPDQIDCLWFRTPKLRHIRSPSGMRLILESSLGPEGFIVARPGQYYFDGYWQNKSLIGPGIDVIRKYFDIRKYISAEFETYESLAGPQEVRLAVHIRRGDYISNTSASNANGFIGEEYFKRALKHVQHRKKDATILVFSDDMPWSEDFVRSVCPSSRVLCVDPVSPSLFDEIQLMSRCGSVVMSNSTFSWWASELSNRKVSEIIYPREWFADHRSAPAIFDTSWVEL